MSTMVKTQTEKKIEQAIHRNRITSTHLRQWAKNLASEGKFTADIEYLANRIDTINMDLMEFMEDNPGMRRGKR